MVTNGSWARLGGDSVAGQLDILRTYRGLGLNSEQVSGQQKAMQLNPKKPTLILYLQEAPSLSVGDVLVFSKCTVHTCTVLCRAVLYCTVLYCTVLCTISCGGVGPRHEASWQVVGVEAFLAREDYDQTTHENDIAILRSAQILIYLAICCN